MCHYCIDICLIYEIVCELSALKISPDKHYVPLIIEKSSLVRFGGRSRRKSDIKELFLGSVSPYVVHKSSIPVFVMK
ncbi:MAG: universal stress protein [Candidatus Nitrosotenuis sp.]|nr:MAG: universal stress protein [Candidatus Nitrosotenuis sp.]